MNVILAANFARFQQFQQFQQFPSQKTIINFSNINGFNDVSFMNATLQALGSINYLFMWTKNWSNNVFMLNNNPKFRLTKEIVNLFYTLYQGQMPDSSNFILRYLNEEKNYSNKTSYNSIDFLFYLIQIIHGENNFASNPNQNMNSCKNLTIAQKVNDNYVRNLYFSLLSQTHNSIISQYFLTIFRTEIRCNNCSIQYSYEYKYMIKFKINEYFKFRNCCNIQKSMYKLNLEECFDCYTGGRPCKCEICNFDAQGYKSIFSLPKVLIIALIRDKHSYCGDVDFTNNLNLNGYCVQGSYNQNFYSLRACISLNNQGQTFTDIKTNNNIWFRYYGNQIFQLYNINNDLKTFEPQLLIYES